MVQYKVNLGCKRLHLIEITDVSIAQKNSSVLFNLHIVNTLVLQHNMQRNFPKKTFEKCICTVNIQ